MKTIQQTLELIKLNSYSGTPENIQAIIDLVKEREAALRIHDVVLRSEQLPCGDCENYAEYDGGIKYCSVCGTKLS